MLPLPLHLITLTAEELPADIAADIEASRQELDLKAGVDYERTMEVGWQLWALPWWGGHPWS